MKRPYLAWYLAILLLAFAPVGLRVLTWRAARQTEVDAGTVEAGHTLFTHEWTPRDPLAAGGDGLGPVFNATSCAACHHQGGLGGSGGLKSNVTTFTVRSVVPSSRAQSGIETVSGQAREGVVHAHAVSYQYQETLAQIHPQLPATSQPTLEQLVLLSGHSNKCVSFPRGVHVSQRNTPALFGAKLIDEIPERVIIAGERSQRLKWAMAPAENEQLPAGRALRLADGRVGRFGWKAQTASLADFVQAACANELGLGNPGQPQPRPLARPDYQPPGLDLTLEQCNQLTAFVASLPRPVERIPEDSAARERAFMGKMLFHGIGCAECHTPDLGSVEGIYSDLLLHRMGQEMVGGGSYGEPPLPKPDFKPSEAPRPDEWRTPPLWGVADSGPYMHDGRAATLVEAIELHGGQGASAAHRFFTSPKYLRDELIAFLKTLRAP